MLNKKEKQELLALSKSRTFWEDMRRLKTNRINPFLKKDGEVDINKLIDFLTNVNAFFNHRPKPFKPIKDNLMKL